MYTAKITDLQNPEQLEGTWSSVQATVHDAPFFLTWPWISTWLETYNPQCLQITGYFGQQAVCVGLLTRSYVKRRKLIGARQLRLHQTGIESQDQIWIEYNDFLVSDQHRVAAVSACLQTLASLADWDEFIISMMPRNRTNQVQRCFHHSRILMTAPAYAVSLSPFSRDPAKYMPSLSPNTRYQIRRSVRDYRMQHGNISLEIAATEERAITLFHLAGTLHRTRWSDSGFNNADFVRFHEHLIRSTHASGKTAVLSITAGDRLIGILYFLVDDRTAYFYLQGLNYDNNPKLKPGLVAHQRAIEYFIAKGIQVYDFMGGHSQYKQQLGALTQNLDSLLIQRPRPRFFLENLARTLKDRLITYGTDSR
ncbi:GNAT family N-acetyltransferase [Halochromatium roseum]|uniref:GNAT family N-acetyltransferase n=1 Tax=Halochromatium roseum TaxID=391920 RepID=UPI0019140795|nr:GNAT family N-acetyltransferase [Halochromatium roseum]